MSPSTYLTPPKLSALRRALAEEILFRATKMHPSDATDTAWDICRPDMGGAYLSKVQRRADDRGLRAELDAVVERMAVTS